MSTTIPNVTLNNGVIMPTFGLGVFQSPPADTVRAVEAAIGGGYRMIDTAAAYLNEREVGEGIRRSGVSRGELFVQTKLWISDYGYEPALQAFDASLRRLGLDYVDSYLLHWPMPSDFEATVAAYRACETLLADGRARAIGVCNFSPKHLDDLIARRCVVPAVNQVELHPFFTQAAVRKADARSRHRDAVMVTDRRGQPLQRGRQEVDPGSPSTCNDRQACRTARQDARSNRAPLAHRARPVGDTKVRQSGTHQREHRYF